jgi:TIR domain
VFVSHSSVDTWIALQLRAHIEAAGASTFLDEADIEHGDNFAERILEATDTSDELLLLLTPWSVKRTWNWIEVGAMWGNASASSEFCMV